MGNQIAQALDIDALVRLAYTSGPLPPVTAEEASLDDEVPYHGSLLERVLAVPPVRVGIALDNAFSFYYPETFEEFARLGVDVVPFSPLNDQYPPDDLDLLYFGGGIP